MRQEIFPVPDKGGEYIDGYVPPMDIFNEESDEKDEYGWTPPAWKEELAEKCKNIGKNPSTEKEFFEKILDEICKYELYDDILHVINFPWQMILVSIVFGLNTKNQRRLSTVLAFPDYAQ